jgi:protein-L-isoaspartate(D-aspartate) O-methyltransferase
MLKIDRPGFKHAAACQCPVDGRGRRTATVLDSWKVASVCLHRKSVSHILSRPPQLLGWVFAGFLAVGACRPAPSDAPAGAPELAAARTTLLAELHEQGVTDARVLSAMAQVPREQFVRPQDRALAYANRALPIGGGQTISQPYIVGLMSQLLELRGGERVLEVGTGSGYQAAVLALLARDVYSIEIDAGLADSARARLRALGYANVRVRTGDGFYGWEEAAPFDAIIVTAVAPRIPQRLVDQLKPGGRIVIPVGDDTHQALMRGRKVDGGLQTERVADVVFVPMTGAVRSPSP